MIGRDSRIFTTGHDNHDPYFNTIGDRVVIGDNVVIYPSVLIMPGVTIGNNAVVYPGSVVARSIPEKEIHAGVPAKRVGVRECEIKYTLNYKMYCAV
jgi:acetyltransferase-like isoleucine patch superfamily enzyme